MCFPSRQTVSTQPRIASPKAQVMQAVDREKVLEQQKRNKENEEKRKDEEAKEAVRRQIAADKYVTKL